MQIPIKKSQKIVYQNYRTIWQKVFEIPKNGVNLDNSNQNKQELKQKLNQSDSSENNQKKEIVMEVYGTNQTVLVCAFDIFGNLILNSQFRFGPERFLLEFPGGACDDKENIEKTAQKELLEETGYSGDLQHFETRVDGGYATGFTHIFIAQNCQKIQQNNLETEEIITNLIIKPTEFVKLIQNPDFIHADLLAKLLYLGII